MIALAGSILVTSLIGSPHCAAMCGGFVGFYAGQGGERRVWPHVAYNLGRLVSYATLGLLAGWLGAGIERAGATIGIGRAAAVAAGVLLTAWGIMNLMRALGVSFTLESTRPARHHGLLTGVLRRLHAQSPTVRAATIGLLSTLLPCGWLYAFVAVAAGTGTAWGGAWVMAAFWIGTLPVMASLAVLARTLLVRLGRHVPVVASVVMIALGLLTLAGRMTPALHHHAGHPSSAVHGAAPAAETTGDHDHAGH